MKRLLELSLDTDGNCLWVGFRKDNKSVQGNWPGMLISAKLPHHYGLKEITYIPAEDIFSPVGGDYTKRIESW